MRFVEPPGWTGLAATREAVAHLAADTRLAPSNAELMNDLRLLGRYVLLLEERVAQLESGAAEAEPPRASRPTKQASPPSTPLPVEAAEVTPDEPGGSILPGNADNGSPNPPAPAGSSSLSLAEAVLAVLVEDGVWWTTGELTDFVQRAGTTRAKVSHTTVGVVLMRLVGNLRVEKRAHPGRPNRWQWKAVAP